MSNQTKKPQCKICGSIFHTAFKCRDNPKAVAKHYANIKSMKSKPAKKKPTMVQINKKLKEGGSLTIAEKKIQYKRQKEKAWKAFSDYIRHRDCMATTGTFERGLCVTCEVAGRPSLFDYAKLQSGHAVAGRCNAVLFHDEIVNIQCMQCNRQGNGGLAGDYGNYMTFLVKKYGLEHAEWLQRLKTAYKEYTHADLVDVEKLYKEKLEELKKNDKRIQLL